MNDHTILKGKIVFRKSIDPYDAGMATALQHACTEVFNLEKSPNKDEFSFEVSGEIIHELAKQSWEKFLTDYVSHIKAGFIFYRTGSSAMYRHIFDADHCKWVLQAGAVRYVGKHGFVDHWEHAESFPS